MIEMASQTKLLIISSIIALTGFLITFLVMKRRRKKPSQTETQGLLGSVPIKIIRKRGDSIIVINEKASIKKANKEGELNILEISKNQQLDNFDFTKINRDGEVILIEKADGQLTYADVDKGKITSTGEGMLRDGYYLNQRFVDEAFPINKDSWARWVPLIVVFFAIIGIGISSYLTYNYYKELNKGYVTMSETNTESINQAVQSMERIARSLEIATQNQKGIEEAYRNLILELQKQKAGG